MFRTTILLMAALMALASCRRAWTDADKQQFLGGCLGGAVKVMGEERGKGYCACMLQKAVVRYPNANDARYMRQDTAMKRLALDCLKQP